MTLAYQETDISLINLVDEERLVKVVLTEASSGGNGSRIPYCFMLGTFCPPNFSVLSKCYLSL